MRIEFEIALSKEVRGKKIIHRHIICKQTEADDKATSYIYDYIHNSIHVNAKEIKVKYISQIKRKTIKEFKYIPTYR